MLQRLGGSGATRNGLDTQDTLSFESCSSSMACDMELVRSESSRRCMTRRTAVRKRGVEAVTEGDAEKQEITVTVLWNEAEGVSMNLEGESTSRHDQTSREKKEKIKPKWKEGQIEMRLVKRVRRFKVPKRK